MVLLVFGASGSGTTTLASKLASVLNVKHIDTDDYYWKPTNPPFIESRDTNERVTLLKQDIISAGNVIISGSLSGWGVELTPMLTGAVRLQLEQSERLHRLEARERHKYGDRVLPDGDMYDEHIAFMRWAREYDTSTDIANRSKLQHDNWQLRLTCPVIVLDSINSVEDNMQAVLQWIQINKLL